MKLIESLNVDTIIDNVNRKITILVRNELADGRYTLAVVKKDRKDGKIKLKNASFTVQIPGEKEPRTITTDEKGKAIITDLIMPANGSYEYTIKEIKAPEGYDLLKGEIKAKITFEEKEQIEQITKAEIKKGKEEARISEILPKYVQIEVIDNKEKEEEQKQSQIIVQKVDEEKPEIGLPGVELAIKIENNKGQVQQIQEKTKENGIIQIEGVLLGESGTITIKEIQTIKGYELDTKEKQITYETKDGKIKVTGSDKIKVETEGNNMKIIVSNKANNETSNMHIEKYISKIGSEEIYDTKPEVIKKEDGSIEYRRSGEKKIVEYGEIVEYTIRVYNDGTQSATPKTIIDHIPEGLIYLPHHEINQEYKWEQKEDNKVSTNILNQEGNQIKGYDKATMVAPEYQEVKIVFQIGETKNAKETKNTVSIEQEEEEGRYEQDNEGESEFEIQYAKLKVKKYITQIEQNGQIRQINKEEIKEGYIIKVDINGKQLGKTNLKVTYEIEVTNEGTKEGKVQTVIDKIPEGFQFEEAFNPGWKLTEGVAEYQTEETIGVGQSIKKSIVLTWEAKEENLGNKQNIAMVVGEGDINNDKPAGERENVSDAVILITVKTGQVRQYMVLTGILLSLLAIGIYAIKKYVVGS